jgi:pilus assembly protein CpaE
VLVDIDGQPIQTLDALKPIINNFATCRFVALSSEVGGELVLKAMQVGVRHIQAKQSIQAELTPALLHVAGTVQSTKDLHGKALMMMSSGGGCGCTTLAVNFASELALASSERVLLADLDFNYGSVATYLDLQGSYGICDVLLHENIDSQLIKSTAIDYSANLSVMLSPVSTNSTSFISPEPEKLRSFTSISKSTFAYTLFDAPRLATEPMLALADTCEFVFIAFQLMVPDVRIASKLLLTLQRYGISNDRIIMVANRFRKRGQMVSIDNAEKALGRTVARLSNDYPNATRALNFGKPLSDAAPKSPLRRDMAKLASQVDDMTLAENGKLGAKV